MNKYSPCFFFALCYSTVQKSTEISYYFTYYKIIILLLLRIELVLHCVAFVLFLPSVMSSV